MDTLSPAERSARMSLVRSRNTKPELQVRRIAHAMGHRFRLHVRKLPGCPDLVFTKHRAVVFVHGCFWHQHDCAMGNRTPKSRVEFWRAKLQGNKARDERNRKVLVDAGWRVLVLWECDVKNVEKVKAKLRKLLG